MFVVKKLLAPFLLPPGILSAVMLAIGGAIITRKKQRSGLLFVMLAAVLWAFSIQPLADRLMAGLESEFSMPSRVNGDVIVLLGGGVIDEVADLSGTGAPTDTMMTRIVGTARLHRRLDVPVIVSGGKVYADRPSEAVIARRFLIDLGLAAASVIIEDRARDTRENALFTQQILDQTGYSRPILVTSAFHMRRAVLAFRQVGLTPIPFPVGFKTSPDRAYGWHDYLPTAASLYRTSTALHEYIGLLYYRLFY